MIRTFIPPAQGLVHRVRVLWKEELAAVAQTDAAGQNKGTFAVFSFAQRRA
jgi:hypothetical protein